MEKVANQKRRFDYIFLKNFCIENKLTLVNDITKKINIIENAKDKYIIIAFIYIFIIFLIIIFFANYHLI